MTLEVAVLAREALFGLVIADIDRELASGLSLPMGVSVVPASELAAAVVQRDARGGVVAIDGCCDWLGLVALTEAGRRDLEVVAEELSLLFEPDVPEIFDLSRRGAAELPAWLAERLVERSAGLAADVVQLRRSLATVRREHGEAMTRFAELEASVGQFVTPTRVRRLHHPVGATRVVLGGSGAGHRRLSQTYAASPTGLAVPELHLVDVEGEGALTASVHIGREETSAFAWRYASDELTPGLLRLALDRALTRAGLELTLRLHWEGSGSIALALSTPTPLEDYAVLVDERVRLGAPLAGTLWSMTPGQPVRLPATTITGSTTRRTPVSAPLPSDMLALVKRLRPEETGSGFEPVKFRAAERDVLMHPVEGGPLIAIIRDVPLAEPLSVRALCVVDNDAARPVEFGLAIVPATSKLDDPASLITRWTTVEPLIYAEVAGSVAPDVRGRGHVLLATRMVDGASSHLAWAYVKRIDVVG